MVRSQWLKDSVAAYDTPTTTTAIKHAPKDGKKSGKRPQQTGNERLKSMADTADINELYELSVQSSANEVDTLLMFHRQLLSQQRLPDRPYNLLANGSDGSEDEDQEFSVLPTRLREDFCGTAIVCTEFASRSPLNTAFGVDIDPKVIEFGRDRALNFGLDETRVRLILDNVFTIDRQHQSLPRVDIVCALNYGIFYCHQRKQLVKYFRKCKEALRQKSGIFVCDVFGGSDCYQTGKGKSSTRHFKEFGGFTYHFEQRSFDLLTNRGQCFIHFDFPDGSCIKKAYTYNFRLYTIIEVREALEEAGFTRSVVWIAENEECSNSTKKTDNSNWRANQISEEGISWYRQVKDGEQIAGTNYYNAYIVASP